MQKFRTRSMGISAYLSSRRATPGGAPLGGLSGDDGAAGVAIGAVAARGADGVISGGRSTSRGELERNGMAGGGCAGGATLAVPPCDDSGGVGDTVDANTRPDAAP